MVMSSRQTDTPRYVYSSTLHLCTLCMPCDLWCGLKMLSCGCFIVMSLYKVIDVMKVSGESAIEQENNNNHLTAVSTRVGLYQKKHSPAHTHPGQRTSFITFLHLQRSMASSLFSLRAWQFSRTTSFQVLFGLPLALEPSTSYSMHFFTQSSSFRSTCPYHAACSAAIPMLCHPHTSTQYSGPKLQVLANSGWSV